ncbi:hypothetical protein SAMN05216436_105140 [bacterium A37T11]|nr:hypothetical protein SAMN05216436_105140 [bacterium A37T11]
MGCRSRLFQQSGTKGIGKQGLPAKTRDFLAIKEWNPVVTNLNYSFTE